MADEVFSAWSKAGKPDVCPRCGGDASVGTCTTCFWPEPGRQPTPCAGWEDGDRPCETDDERNTREFGTPPVSDQDGWICWMCAEPVKR